MSDSSLHRRPGNTAAAFVPGSQEPAREGLRILILEDVSTDAELIEVELRRAQMAFASRRVETKEAFLQALEGFAPDLILADYSLPQFNAVDALRLLRQRRTIVPFILVTGTQTEQIAVECMREGADDYILKDTLKRLPSAVRNALRKREAEVQKELAEEALRRGEERYRLIAENTRDLICLLDRGGHLLYVSPSSSALLGYRPEELMQGRALAVIHADDREPAVAAFQRTFTDPTGKPSEIRCQHKNGEWHTFESVGSWVSDANGDPQQAVVVFRDITQRKQAEQQLKQANTELEMREHALLDALSDLKRSHEALQAAHLQLIQAEKMESVGRLAAGVAHEVKNPLTVILMGVEFLARHMKPGDGEVSVILQDMDDAVKRANTVIGGLLDFSTPGRLELQRERLDEIVDKSLGLVKHEFARAKVTVVRELAKDLPLLRLDRNKIEQVFVNIFLNAVHAMPEGGTLTVRTSLRDLAALGSGARRPAEGMRRSEDVVVVEIEDTGVGIPADKLTKIFDPFFTTKPVGKGTGLGLTVIHKIVEMHGGTILLKNRSEGGVRVTMVFQPERSS
jgi:PAS domain S-box-containing protein